MKKTLLSLAVVATTLMPSVLNAQSKNQVSPTTFKKSLYCEVGTTGLGLTLNYDMRLTPGTNGGFGFNIGIGAAATDAIFYSSLPIGINYLLGERKNFFEVGLTVTPIYMNRSRDYSSYRHYDYDNPVPSRTHEHRFAATLNPLFGWRYQPPRKGVLFAVGLSPMFSFNREVISSFPVGGYVRIGYSF